MDVVVVQSCPILLWPRDCSPPGSSVHGISQARTLEWVAVAFSVVSCRVTKLRWRRLWRRNWGQKVVKGHFKGKRWWEENWGEKAVMRKRKWRGLRNYEERRLWGKTVTGESREGETEGGRCWGWNWEQKVVSGKWEEKAVKGKPRRQGDEGNRVKTRKCDEEEIKAGNWEERLTSGIVKGDAIPA